MTHTTKTSDVYISMQIVRIKTGTALERSEATRALLDKGAEKVLARMIDSLDEANWQHQQHLVTAIAQFGNSAVDLLLTKLESSEPMGQVGIAHVLGEIGDARATQPLISLMRTEEIEVRNAAAAALSKLGQRALRALVLALRDQNWRVRAGAAVALTALHEKHAMYPLIASLHDPYAQVRANAARALGELGDNRAVEPLLNALRDSELLVRSQVAVALGRIGDPRAVTPLVNTLKNAKPASVRANAALGLGLLNNDTAIPALVEALGDEAISVQSWASGALVRHGIAAVPTLIGALKDPSYPGRKRAIWALGALGDPRACDILKRLGDDLSAGDDIRAAVQTALSKIEAAQTRAAETAPAESATPQAAATDTASPSSPDQPSAVQPSADMPAIKPLPPSTGSSTPDPPAAPDSLSPGTD